MRHPQPNAGPATLLSPDTTTAVVQHHFRIPVERLRKGMFVAELDRPWIDTPFLIQGFIIDSPSELQTLQTYCRHVFVDLHLSNPDVADVIRKAEQLGDERTDITARGDFKSFRNTDTGVILDSPDDTDTRPFTQKADKPAKPLPANGKHRIRREDKPSVTSQQRFRDFLRDSNGGQSHSIGANEPVWLRLWSMATGLFGRHPSVKQRDRADRKILDASRKLRAEARKSLPPDAQLVKYTDKRPVQEELPRARAAVKSSETVLKKVLGDIQSGAIPDVEKVQGVVNDMVDSMVSNPDAMIWVARLREEDTTTYSHGVRVSLYMMLLGRQIGFPKEQLSQLGMIGMLADVGKLEVPRSLLEKPGMLTDREHDTIKQHVEAGIRTLKTSGKLAPEIELGILEHHERIDGSGYPKGLKGDAISMFGRIAGIADTFAALITSRPYANAQAAQDALMNLYHWAGTSFHDSLVEQFVQAVGVFPVGSLVELSSGEIAVVIAQNRVRRLEPRVLLLTWPDKRPLANPIERDLFKALADDQGQRLRISRGLPSGAFGLKLRDYYADSVVHANNLV